MKVMIKHTIHIVLVLISFFICRELRADADYDMGAPTLKELWVDPVNGKDAPGRGSTRLLAVKSVRYAWAFLPNNQELTNIGYVIKLCPGTYSPDDVPSIFQSVWGTAEFPVIFQAADDTGAVIFPSIDVTTCFYFYAIGITFQSNQESYVASFRACDHILLRNCKFLGKDTVLNKSAEIGLTFYQCQKVFIEGSEVSGSAGSAIALFASQYGHVKYTSLHNYGGNGVYMRGGAAYFTVEENTFSYGGGGGVVCSSHDTSSGLDNMFLPWVHYEVYDVKCFNNVFHNISDAGLSCNGAYNILFAHNTLYQTGLNSSLISLGLARRARSVDKDLCKEYIDSGAWGTWYLDRSDSDGAPIPNKNIFIYNNIFSNSMDSATAGGHLSVGGALSATAFNAVCPRPAYADDNVEFRGNIIWNGNSDKSLGLIPGAGCGPENPTCNETQLFGDNTINVAEPEFIGVSFEDFHPKPASTVFTISKPVPIPDFTWSGLPLRPAEPSGSISNSITIDRDSNIRNPNSPICGAFIISKSSVSASSYEDVSLLQNYPNPAHGITTISFHLRNRSEVTLEVFNLLGEKISSLIHATLDEGDHSAEMNTSDVHSGKYFYRLATGRTTMTKQMAVVR